jgi:hypothetical protein
MEVSVLEHLYMPRKLGGAEGNRYSVLGCHAVFGSNLFLHASTQVTLYQILISIKIIIYLQLKPVPCVALLCSSVAT